jgi:hypothetical protein
MSSERYRFLCQRIDNIEDWKAAALCAVCASKVAPVVVSIGLPNTWNLVLECLEYVWASLNHAVDNERGLTLAQALEATPEWQCEDNSFLPFAVTEALDFVKLAVLAVAVPSAAKKNAKGALDALGGIASGYDLTAEESLLRELRNDPFIRLESKEALRGI